MPAPLSASPAPASITRAGLAESVSWGRGLAQVTLAAVLFFFALLGSRPLSNPDEGRYSEIPREMLASGDFVTPRLDGVKYFEKPPLVYWLNAAALSVFGRTEFAARFWMAVFAVAGCVLTYAAGRDLQGHRVGLASAAVLGSCFLYYIFSRVVLLDLVVTVWIAAALFAFLAAQRRPAGNARRWLFWAFYAAMGLATLTKGLIGFVLPGGAIALWLVVTGRWRALRPFHPFSGGLLFLAITLPWHLLVAKANPDFAWFYFVHEHFQRFTTTVHRRVEPFWFFAPVLLAGLFPWVGFLPAAVKAAFSRRTAEGRRESEAWFLALWVAVIFVFFSLSQSKLIPYILPVFPALAVMLGAHLATLWGDTDRMTRGTRAAAMAAAGIMLVLGVALLLVKLPSSAAAVAGALRPLRPLLALPLAAGAGLTLWFALRGAPRPALASLALGWVLFLVPANRVGGLLDARSTRPLAEVLAPRLAAGDTVYCIGEYFQDLPFYLGRTVDVAGYEGELSFGIHAEPGRQRGRFLERDAFLQRWRAPGRAFAVVKRRDAPAWFPDYSDRASVLAETPRYLLLSNQPR